MEIVSLTSGRFQIVLAVNRRGVQTPIGKLGY
jgi:hypothetical protein